MALLAKIKSVALRYGPEVVKTTLGALIPGASPVIDLIEQLLGIADEATQDQLEGLASAEDLRRIEKLLEILESDFDWVKDKLDDLEEALAKALEDREEVRKAADRMKEVADKFDLLLRIQKKTAQGVQELQAVLPDVGRIRAFVEDFHAAGVTGEALARDLRDIKQALADLSRGKPAEAEPIFEKVARRFPTSAIAAKAVAAAQVAARQFVKAGPTVARARRLCPNDPALAALDRKVTELSQPHDTPTGRAPQPMPHIEGATIDGWLLEKLLGYGGWGQVYLVRRGERQAALKIMHPELARDYDFVNRFKKEIAALTLVGKHPNLIQIETFDRHGDCWYFVMEYVEGTTLERYLQKKGALVLAQASRVFKGVAEALRVAHDKGLVHRDIKPANILLRKDGTPVLADFGLAGVTDSTGQTKLSGYTAQFASPEQRCGDAADRRSDIYSLAASIYYALLYNDAVKRVPYQFKPDAVAEELRDLLKRSLSGDPDERPQNAGEFLADWLKPKPLPVVHVAEVVEPVKPAPPKPKGPKPGDIITNSIGMKLAWIPPGKFLMGSPDSEDGHAKDEGPQHEVELTRGFYLGVHPVTQEEYQKVAKTNPSYFSSSGDGKAKVTGLDTRQFPVEQVSWEEAMEFCRRLSEIDGKSYDLPTEAEWEYACRGGVAQYQAYHFGNSLTTRHANFNNTLGRTSKVGSYPANAFGLFDMHGNVWEWVKDCYEEGYYNKSPKVDPECTSGSSRVNRGGGWLSVARLCRSAIRVRDDPAYRSFNLGFRLALVPS